MKQSKAGSYYLFLTVIISFFLAGEQLHAQARKLSTPGASTKRSDNIVRIERLPPPNKTAVIRTPEYNVQVQNTMPKVTRRPREWALFEVKYSTSAKWTDSLTFNYHVMTKGVDDDNKEIFNYYTTVVRYIDIPKGSHMSCVAIPPSQVERYGSPVAVALEIVDQDGEICDTQAEESTIALPDEWWKSAAVLDNEKLKRRVGMVDRSKTPFALINIDDYEVVQ